MSEKKKREGPTPAETLAQAFKIREEKEKP